MSLAMTRAEREKFLADLHVGVVSANRQGEGPLSAPIWYMYEDGVVWFSTGAESRKGQIMNVGDRISMVVQSEQAPYQYVSIEGPIESRDPVELDRDIRPMAIRYLGEVQGNQYADASSEAGSVVIRMRPEEWLTVDYRKA